MAHAKALSLDWRRSWNALTWRGGRGWACRGESGGSASFGQAIFSCAVAHQATSRPLTGGMDFPRLQPVCLGKQAARPNLATLFCHR